MRGAGARTLGRLRWCQDLRGAGARAQGVEECCPLMSYGLWPNSRGDSGEDSGDDSGADLLEYSGEDSFSPFTKKVPGATGLKSAFPS